MGEGNTPTTTLVGIDEAGYGPILGPLVVSAVLWEVPRDSADDLAGALSSVVARDSSGRDGRIAIIDSKKLYSRKDGLGRLERSALAMVHAANGDCAVGTTADLLKSLCPTVESLLEYPWYAADDRGLPVEADAGGVRIAAAQLRRGLTEAGVRVAWCRSEILPEGHFNQQVERTRNKAAVSFAMVLRLIQDAARRARTNDVRFLIDRQGGREHYGPLLLRSFDGRRLKIAEESDSCSNYELRAGSSTWHVEFRKSGDSFHIPVAAASILSKYVRELLMGRFNAWWAREVEGLRPTAGYYTDGMRFLRDIGPSVRRLGIQKTRLVRAR